MAEEVTKELTGKQRRFIEAYLGPAMGNATRAAEIAGYSSTSKKSLASQGWENLRNPEIAAIIKERLDELSMSANEVLAGLREIAEADMGDFLDIDGFWGSPTINLKKAVEAGKTRLIKKVARSRKGFEFELYDRQAALVQLGKYHKLFTEKSEVSVTGSVEVRRDLSALTDEELTQLEELVERITKPGNGPGGEGA